MHAIEAWFQWLYATHGINLSVVYDAYDRVRFVHGLAVTLWLSLACIVFSGIIGIAGAWLQDARSRALRAIVEGYVQFFRNTPPLVQLYFFFFAIGAVLPKTTDAFGGRIPPIGNLAWATISFSLFAGAFNIEILRSGIEAVPATTLEAAEALGYSRFGVYRYVALPLALRVCLPALGNNLVNLVKTTTLAYAIAVPELLYASAQIWSEQSNVREMMNLLLFVYLAIVGTLVWTLQAWERSLRMPGYGR